MAKYAVSVGKREYQVEVKDSHLLIDDELVSFELTSLNGNGLHLFRRNSENREMYFKTVPGDAYEVVVEGQRVVARVDPANRRGRRRAAEVVEGEVRAPMPGLVVEVLVEEGDVVEADQVLLVQESMKMQMQLRAPIAGRVQRLSARSGEQVEKAALLLQVVPQS